jgi:hypothetical protein
MNMMEALESRRLMSGGGATVVTTTATQTFSAGQLTDLTIYPEVLDLSTVHSISDTTTTRVVTTPSGIVHTDQLDVQTGSVVGDSSGTVYTYRQVTVVDDKLTATGEKLTSETFLVLIAPDGHTYTYGNTTHEAFDASGNVTMDVVQVSIDNDLLPA